MIFDLDGTPPDIGFPDTELAESDPNGLLAVGGDLSQARLLHAYRNGIFPWFSVGQPILWWSPAPRMVLNPNELHISRSLRKSIRNGGFQTSIDVAFEAVIHACAAPRLGHEGTWLVPEMINAYVALHQAGYAHSFEVWHAHELAGGLYGVAIGQAFFGESMFSHRRDASKIAMALLARTALKLPYQMIDCQIYTDHLASMGAREISRRQFHERLILTTNAKAGTLLRQAPQAAAELLS